MSVLLTCDLCKQEQVLEPGDQSMYIGAGIGWVWIKASSFDSQFIILPEIRCPDCETAIKVARHNAELIAREQRIARAS